MKKPLLSLFALGAINLVAQPTFTASDLVPQFGPSPTIYFGNYIAAGPATAGFTYNASSIMPGTASSSQTVMPSSTPYAQYFPQATHSTTALTNPQLYSFLKYTATEVLNLGNYGPTSNLIYSNPEKVYPIPLSFGVSFTDQWSASGTNQGSTYTRIGNTTGNYNGYGTVILSFGTFTNVARYEIYQNFQDDFGFLQVPYQVKVVTYLKQWLATSLFSTAYVLADFGGGMDTLSSYSTLIDPAIVGIHNLSAPELIAHVYPNPASNSATLELLETPGSALTATVMDATGRVVRVVAGADVAFTQRMTFDVSDLRAGTYFVVLSDAEGRTGSLPLVVE